MSVIDFKSEIYAFGSERNAKVINMKFKIRLEYRLNFITSVFITSTIF